MRRIAIPPTTLFLLAVNGLLITAVYFAASVLWADGLHPTWWVGGGVAVLVILRFINAAQERAPTFVEDDPWESDGADEIESDLTPVGAGWSWPERACPGGIDDDGT